MEYRDLAFGVVLDGPEYSDDVASGQCLQVGWMATRPEATNFALLSMERALNLDEVLALAPRIGIPAQNLLVGGVGGRIAWTVMGRMPRNTGPGRYFGALDFRDASDHPRITDPPVGRLWTANQRVVDGPLETVLADDEVEVGADGYDIGARARQIRDDLLGLTHPATEADMLAIQLDARALFVARWRDHLLALIDEEAMHDAPRRREFRDLVSQWKPAAAPDSVGYRLVRAYRSDTLDELWRGLVAGLLGEKVALRRPGQFEAAGWRLVSERPTAIPPPESSGDRLARVPVARARRHHRGTDRGMWVARELHLWRGRSGARAASTGARRAAAVAAARHAHAAAARRSPHAARAGWRFRGFGEIRGVSGPRVRGLPRASRRAFRPPAVAVLPQRFRRLGRRSRDAIPAGTGSA